MKIAVSQNGDLEGEGVTMDMDDWHDIIETELTKLYPGAEITVKGEPNVYGGNSASITHDDGRYENISDVINRIFETAAVDDPRWTTIDTDDDD